MTDETIPEPGDAVWFVPPLGGERTKGVVDAIWPEEGTLRIRYGDRILGIYSLDEVEPA